jgi:XTP/dITP diphosphohydrolase
VTGSIKVILTTPRVAPGLLTRTAWQAFDEANEVLAASTPPERPDVVALESAGYVVGRVDGDAVDHWARLTAAAASGGRVAWLVGDDGEPALLRLIADSLHRAAEAGPQPEYEVEIVHGSYDVPGARLIDLVRVMDRLRRNCPWDQEQTHESLAKYLLEETYETLEAIDSGDRAHLREELGDLLLQVVFHSRIAEEGRAVSGTDPADAFDEDSGEPFSIDDVAGDIVEKLIRRHPHVFADTRADDAAAVEANWETIKAAEKQRTSVLEGIPLALPALALADKLLSRAAKVLPDDLPPAPLPSSDRDRVGETLMDLVRRSRSLGVDPEQALREAARRLADGVREAEKSRDRQ